VNNRGHNNLFTNLSKWAIRQNENFTTEILVYLINYLLVEEPVVASKLLCQITDGFLDGTTLPDKIKITTQTVIDEGRPDIEISTDDHVVYIEVKIDSALGEDQLKRYRNALDSLSNKKTSLIYLSRYPFDSDENGKPDVMVRWYQIADWISHELMKSNIQPISKYLLEEFHRYLKGQNLVLSKVRSDVSEGLNAYRTKHGDVAASLQRMRSFAKLDSDVNLRPLSNLLKLMKEAFGIIGIKPRFESGQNKGGWAGFVFNSIESTFSIYYSQPETILFETFYLPIDTNKFDGTFGKLWNEGTRLMWKSELNLSDTSFFSEGKKGQVKMIESFLKRSYEYTKGIESDN
jgi:PD-(D/E)XK nuclease superfamily protein